MALKKNEAAELAKAEAALDSEAKAAAVKEEPTPEPEVKEEPTPEPEVKEEPAPETEVKEEPAKTLVKVVNLTHSTLFQHSTGLSIGPKAEKDLLNDGWLANQIKARLLKRV
jgi:outer membrane biosynthesis protein TonB